MMPLALAAVKLVLMAVILTVVRTVVETIAVAPFYV